MTPAEARAAKTFQTCLAPSRPCTMGPGVLRALGPPLAQLAADRVFVICDEWVQGQYGAALGEILRGLPVEVCVVERGEGCKTLAALEALAGELMARGASKDSVLVAFGGGAVGNLTGMTAALLFRGIRFVQVPTTLLAQTDSTLSNKQAVNGAAAKNILGVFYAPEFIWADTLLPLTEDAAHLKGALVESVKNGLVSDPAFLDYLDGMIDRVLAREPAAVQEVAYRSALSKVAILQRDPTEKRYAMCLEYGHTLGHALERLCCGRLSHGQAVAIGIMAAARLSRRMGLLDAAAVERHRYFLRDRLELSLDLPEKLAKMDLLEAIRADNKRSGKGLRVVLLKGIGEVVNGAGDCLVAVEEGMIGELVGGRGNE